MNLAILILMLSALPVLYYYYSMYEINEKTRYIIGLLAGGWAFVGVLLINAGIIGITYFIVYFLLIILVYVFEKIMPYINEDFEEADQEEYEREWPVDVENSTMAILVCFIVILMYVFFFFTPVSPARADETTGFDEDEEIYKVLPNAYKYEYKSTLYQSYVVIITARSIPLNPGMLDSSLDYARPLVEDYIKEKYSQDATLEFREENELEIDGHDAVEKIYDVRWQSLGNQRTAIMKLQAFFYHEDLETIIIGYVYQPDGQSVTSNLVDSISFS